MLNIYYFKIQFKKFNYYNYFFHINLKMLFLNTNTHFHFQKFLIFILLILTIFPLTTSDMIKSLYSHKQNSTVAVSVGSMNSIETQIPFEYYYLQICPPEVYIQEPDNLGEILTGDKSYKSTYEFKIGQNEYCKVMCAKNFSSKDVALMQWMIARNYTVSWYLDKLPAGLRHVLENNANDKDSSKMRTEVHYLGGVPLGYLENEPADGFASKIYNHLTFTVQLHSEGNEMYSVVGFNVMPFSIYQNSTTGGKCGDKENFMRNFRAERQGLVDQEILFTYDVIFEYSNLAFSSRWDHYLHLQNDNIHWFSLINSSLIILIFSFIVLHIFSRALKRDIDIYNTRVTNEEIIDEFGWKQVCNDVFRRPPFRMLLSALIGTGIQIFSMVFYTLIFAIIGFLTPDKRGSLLMIMIFVFVFMGVFAGYYSSRFYKMFGGKDWLKTSMLTAFLYPSILFSIFLIMNVMFWMEKSSAGVKITDIVALLLLWTCCSSPLVLIGSFMGIKKKVMKNPCKVNPVPSSIPDKPWYLKLRYNLIITGLIPFA